MSLIQEIGTLALATRMQKLGEVMRKEASLIYQEQGIDFESKWFPVVYVLSKKSPLAVCDLAEECGYAHPSVIALVKDLQRKNMVQSHPDKEDGRKRLLSLTDEAWLMVNKMKPLWDKMQAVNNVITNNTNNLLQAIEEAEQQLQKESFYDRMQGLLDREVKEITIREFTSSYQDQVREHVFAIENEEFGMDLTLEDQPDLIDIDQAYRLSGGKFWIATDAHDKVVGSIGLFPLGGNVAALRKMFVNAEYRGKDAGVSQRLLNTLLAWAGQRRFHKVILETTTAFVAARKFYRKNGFREIERTNLPPSFPIVKVAAFFFELDIKTPNANNS